MVAEVRDMAGKVVTCSVANLVPCRGDQQQILARKWRGERRKARLGNREEVRDVEMLIQAVSQS